LFGTTYISVCGVGGVGGLWGKRSHSESNTAQDSCHTKTRHCRYPLRTPLWFRTFRVFFSSLPRHCLCVCQHHHVPGTLLYHTVVWYTIYQRSPSLYFLSLSAGASFLHCQSHSLCGCSLFVVDCGLLIVDTHYNLILIVILILLTTESSSSVKKKKAILSTLCTRNSLKRRTAASNSRRSSSTVYSLRRTGNASNASQSNA
jgi:hypothetical protein